MTIPQHSLGGTTAASPPASRTKEMLSRRLTIRLGSSNNQKGCIWWRRRYSPINRRKEVPDSISKSGIINTSNRRLETAHKCPKSAGRWIWKKPRSRKIKTSRSANIKRGQLPIKVEALNNCERKRKIWSSNWKIILCATKQTRWSRT